MFQFRLQPILLIRHSLECKSCVVSLITVLNNNLPDVWNALHSETTVNLLEKFANFRRRNVVLSCLLKQRLFSTSDHAVGWGRGLSMTAARWLTQATRPENRLNCLKIPNFLPSKQNCLVVVLTQWSEFGKNYGTCRRACQKENPEFRQRFLVICNETKPPHPTFAVNPVECVSWLFPLLLFQQSGHQTTFCRASPSKMFGRTSTSEIDFVLVLLPVTDEPTASNKQEDHKIQTWFQIHLQLVDVLLRFRRQTFWGSCLELQQLKAERVWINSNLVNLTHDKYLVIKRATKHWNFSSHCYALEENKPMNARNVPLWCRQTLFAFEFALFLQAKTKQIACSFQCEGVNRIWLTLRKLLTTLIRFNIRTAQMSSSQATWSFAMSWTSNSVTKQTSNCFYLLWIYPVVHTGQLVWISLSQNGFSKHERKGDTSNNTGSIFLVEIRNDELLKARNIKQTVPRAKWRLLPSVIAGVSTGTPGRVSL